MTPLLSPSQQQILRSLARYTFLTSSQIVRLGIISHKKNLSRTMQPLKEPSLKLVTQVAFPFVPSKGRLENFYYLTSKGKDILTESGIVPTESIKYPKGGNIYFTQDYFHRKYTIDCHIACDSSAKKDGYQVLHFDRYIDKVGNNRCTKKLQAKTKVSLPNDYLIADATLLLQKGGASRLFALELYNDKDVKRISKQINKHTLGIQHSSLCKNYGIRKGHRLLVVCTHPEVIASIQKKLSENSMKDYIVFASYESIQNNFLEGRCNIQGERIQLF